MNDAITTATPSKFKRLVRKRTCKRNIVQFILLSCGVCCCVLGLWIGATSTANNSGGSNTRSTIHLERLQTASVLSLHSTKQHVLLLQQQQHSIRSPRKTLALLYPPGLIGGYRNQVIRFFALVEYAMQHNIPQLYLPSLFWSTQINGSYWDPIPMDWVFDISHWNNIASSSGLPILTYTLDGPSDCWVSFADADSIISINHTRRNDAWYAYQNHTFNHLRHATILHGGLQPIFPNISLPLLMDQLASQLSMTRKIDYLGEVEHCQNPYVFGGGIRAGRLWKQGTKLQSPSHVVSAMYRALRPQLFLSCVLHPYTALHARVELDMLQHQCGKLMERNLRNIVAQAHSVSNTTNNLFIAVAKHAMTGTPERYSNELLSIGMQNVVYLEAITQQPNIYECGKTVLDEYYASHPGFLNRGSLFESVLNFQIAVEADVFVGVEGSSYSTDVLRTRYFVGKQEGNFRYTKTGIERVDGLTKPHTDCKRQR